MSGGVAKPTAKIINFLNSYYLLIISNNYSNLCFVYNKLLYTKHMFQKKWWLRRYVNSELFSAKDIF